MTWSSRSAPFRSLKASPDIAQVCVVGDRRPYLVALLALDDTLGADAQDEEEALALVEQAVADVNAERGRAKQRAASPSYTGASGKNEARLTPTLKPRRRVFEQHYPDEIERLYTGASRE